MSNDLITENEAREALAEQTPAVEPLGRPGQLPQPLEQLQVDALAANAFAQWMQRTNERAAVNIQGKSYVMAEGWVRLAATCGIMPRESKVEQTTIDGVPGWVAYVDLVDRYTGRLVGGASHICMRSENRWKTADEYAVRSMAVTRATGKACRLALSHIMALVGTYEMTPAEEMPAEQRPGKKKSGYSKASAADKRAVADLAKAAGFDKAWVEAKSGCGWSSMTNSGLEAVREALKTLEAEPPAEEEQPLTF